jgi:hypothetical protein
MLANSPWRQLRVRAEKIPGDQKHDYELEGYSHTLNTLRSSIQNTNTSERVAGNADNDVQDRAVSRTCVAWRPNEKRKSSGLNKNLRFQSAQMEVTVNLHPPEFEELQHVSM